MSTSARPNNGFHFLFLTGIGVVVVALVWWLAYYGQAGGLFANLEEKFFCFFAYNDGCAAVRSEIEGGLPVYLPWLLWIGVIEIVVGVFLTRKAEIASDTGAHA